MAAQREYELVLMLDPGQDAPARDAVLDETKKQIEAAGTLKHENAWGLRKMAYEIDGRNEADYRWLRFEAPTELLGELDHNLKIADGVLRFRIFKVDADTPVMAPPATSAPGPGASRERPAQGAPAAAPPAEATAPAATEASAPTAVADPPAEATTPEPAAEAPEAEAASPEPTPEPEPTEDPAEGEPGDSAA
ncbi:MAG TPA: 30S ribosomal protein S6 [Solirubrobacterales bacterium]|nr:30S ribosomal protein S6 [Solirubrobacterales bacterium]